MTINDKFTSDPSNFVLFMKKIMLKMTKENNHKVRKTKKRNLDRDRTRTCNPQIRSLMPYPLGHTTLGMDRRKLKMYTLRAW